MGSLVRRFLRTAVRAGARLHGLRTSSLAECLSAQLFPDSDAGSIQRSIDLHRPSNGIRHYLGI